MYWDTPVFTITGGVASNSYTFKIDGGFDTHTNTPTFDPVALGFVFAPGVTYSVDATIYDKPLSGANPDPTACTNNTSSITIIEATPAVVIAITGATNETFCSGDNVEYLPLLIPQLLMLPTIISYSMVLQPFKMVPLILPVDQH